MLRTGQALYPDQQREGAGGISWGPKGTLWGWLFPPMRVVGPNVPQRDHWFLPQLDVPSR